MKDEGISIDDVQVGGYSLFSLISAGHIHDADHTVEELVNENLSATDIRNCVYTAPEMVSHFSSLQMRGAGF